MKLYDYFRSSASYRVRIALNWKGVAYEQLPVNLLEGQQRSVEYRAVNPQQLVPTLDTGSGLLSQSLAICEYLEETFPEPSLLPPDPLARAHVRSLRAGRCLRHPPDRKLEGVEQAAAESRG